MKLVKLHPATSNKSQQQQFSPVLIGSGNLEYPWIFTVLQTERKMARRFAKVSEEEIEEAFFYPSDLVNTKTTIPLRVGEERWIYTSTLAAFVCIHHYSPPLRRIVVYYTDSDYNNLHESAENSLSVLCLKGDLALLWMS